MKQNKIKILYGAILLIGIAAMSSCSQSFLDIKPKGQVLENNYYATPDEALAGVVAAYAPMGITCSNSGTTYCAFEGLANAASDECYSGGGSAQDQVDWTAMNNMSLLAPALMPSTLWNVNFMGVNYSNIILSKLDGVPGLSDADKARYTAEAKFLRAYYYFHLARWFGNVPLFTAPPAPSDLQTAKQSTPSEVYAQIEQDLTDAIPDLPVTITSPATENGRATQGAAKALLGKVYLYAQKWTDAANILKDVNGTPGGANQYGYQLMANYGNIFTQKFNSESIFEIQYTSSQNYGDWGNLGSVRGNVYSIMVGPRNYVQVKSTAPNLMAGWGFTPVSTDMYDAMVVNGVYDPRYKYTIYNMDSLMAAGACTYDQNSNNFPAYETKYYMVKFAPLMQYIGSGGDQRLNISIDYIEIRLADTYLMEAEALMQGGGDQSRAQALLNAVRARVGLPPVPVSIDAIKNERHLELATEGHRFFDLVRWGDADKVLNHMENGVSKNFVVGKSEILPIPLAELTNTAMVQNPGY